MTKIKNEVTETSNEPTETVTKTPRVRKVTITPTVSDTSVSLVVAVIGQSTVELNLEVAELPAYLLNQLALRGITSFIHDKTAGAKDVSTIPALVEAVFSSVKEGTIFNSARSSKVDVVDLPKFVEAIMVRDNLDRTDKVTRQEALDAWNSLGKEDKAAIRSDKVLMGHVAILNGETARAKLGL
jgi:hypothetical protein